MVKKKCYNGTSMKNEKTVFYSKLNNIKVKVRFTLQPAMKTQRSRRRRSSRHIVLLFHCDGGGWLRPCPGCFIPRNDPLPTVQKDG
jgi:hypothetical protein